MQTDGSQSQVSLWAIKHDKVSQRTFLLRDYFGTNIYPPNWKTTRIWSLASVKFRPSFLRTAPLPTWVIDGAF